MKDLSELERDKRSRFFSIVRMMPLCSTQDASLSPRWLSCLVFGLSVFLCRLTGFLLLARFCRHHALRLCNGLLRWGRFFRRHTLWWCKGLLRRGRFYWCYTLWSCNGLLRRGRFYRRHTLWLCKGLL